MSILNFTHSKPISIDTLLLLIVVLQLGVPTGERIHHRNAALYCKLICISSDKSVIQSYVNREQNNMYVPLYSTYFSFKPNTGTEMDLALKLIILLTYFSRHFYEKSKKLCFFKF
jgi:hypothetical protein